MSNETGGEYLVQIKVQGRHNRDISAYRLNDRENVWNIFREEVVSCSQNLCFLLSKKNKFSYQLQWMLDHT